MKVIPVMATKGGVGKTRVCTGLGRALREKGFKVGFLDADWVAPNLHIGLGIESKDLHLVLELGVGDVIKPVISPEGFPLVSSAFVFPADQAVSMDEESKIRDLVEITSPGVVDWGPLDYLLVDTPPSTAEFVQTVLSIKDLHGVVMVTQPAVLALADLLRTVSLLRDLHIPVLGLVGNQVYMICPHGEKVSLYDLNEDDIKVFCKSQGLSYLGSIPHVVTGQRSLSMNGIVDNLVTLSPSYLQVTPVSSLPYKLLLAIARRKKGVPSG